MPRKFAGELKRCPKCGNEASMGTPRQCAIRGCVNSRGREPGKCRKRRTFGTVSTEARCRRSQACRFTGRGWRPKSETWMARHPRPHRPPADAPPGRARRPRHGRVFDQDLGEADAIRTGRRGRGCAGDPAAVRGSRDQGGSTQDGLFQAVVRSAAGLMSITHSPGGVFLTTRWCPSRGRGYGGRRYEGLARIKIAAGHGGVAQMARAPLGDPGHRRLFPFESGRPRC
jgi:hypothetical protein